MGVRLTGTVKWFSSKKGFGFIVARVKQGGFEEQEIFVHQTSILGAEDGRSFRTLDPNTVVEFEVEHDAESDKPKALNVTAPGGQPLELPQRRLRQKRFNKKEPLANGNGNATKSKLRRPKNKPEAGLKEAPFHAILTDSVRNTIKEKSIDLDSKGTVDVAVGDARVKLGLGQYAGLAHKDGILAEGEYSCDEKGSVTITWARAIKFEEGSWQPYKPEQLLHLIELTGESVKPVALDETPVMLWGPDKTDPREALEHNAFLMRRVVLTRPPRQPKTSQNA